MATFDGITLTENAIPKILDGQFVYEPILQVLAYKALAAGEMDSAQNPGQPQQNKYRLMCSDGTSTHQRVVVNTPDVVESIKQGKLEKFTIIKLTNYSKQDIIDSHGFERKVIYAITVEVLRSGREVNVKLGNPVISRDPPPKPAQQLQPQQPQQQMNQQQQMYQQQPPQPYQQQPPQPYQQQPPQPYQQQPPQPYQQQPPQPYQQQPPQMYQNTNSNGSNGSSHLPNVVQRPYDNNNFNNQQQKTNQYGSPHKTNIKPVIPSTPSGRSCSDQAVIDIASLTPYIGGKWVIKGRVTQKSTVRVWSNAKGEGKLFSFTITDKSGEIKLSAFNQDCDKWYNYLQQNKIYYVAKGQIKTANKRYTNAEYECTLNSDSQIEECVDTQSNLEVPQIRYDFVPIGSLSTHAINTPVDIIGIIDTVGELGTVVMKTKNKEIKKLNITIVDMTRHDISVTLWGEAAENFKGQVGQVFVSKAARLGDFGGRSISAGDAIWLDPDLPEVRKMKNWFGNLVDSNFTHLTTTNSSQGSSNEWRMLRECSDMNFVKSQPDTAIYSKVKATIEQVGPKPIYRCCPTDKCGKKLEDGATGDYNCSKCHQTYQTCKFRYKVDIQISDATCHQWITLWDEKAENLIGMKPEELHLLIQQDKDQEKYERIMQAPHFKTFIFTLKTGLNTYNDEERLRHHVMSLSPIDPVSYGKKLVDDIKIWSQSL